MRSTMSSENVWLFGTDARPPSADLNRAGLVKGIAQRGIVAECASGISNMVIHGPFGWRVQMGRRRPICPLVSQFQGWTDRRQVTAGSWIGESKDSDPHEIHG